MKGAAVSASTRNLTFAALVSLVGLGDAIYLTVEHLTGNSVRCTVTSGCSEVLGSAYASIGAIPVAGLGALAYFTAFSLATLAAFGNQWTRISVGRARGNDVGDDTLAAVRPGIHASCLLPVLPAFSRCNPGTVGYRGDRMVQAQE
jgi:hypothetical protein